MAEDGGPHWVTIQRLHPAADAVRDFEAGGGMTAIYEDRGAARPVAACTSGPAREALLGSPVDHRLAMPRARTAPAWRWWRSARWNW